MYVEKIGLSLVRRNVAYNRKRKSVTDSVFNLLTLLRSDNTGNIVKPIQFARIIAILYFQKMHF